MVLTNSQKTFLISTPNNSSKLVIQQHTKLIRKLNKGSSQIKRGVALFGFPVAEITLVKCE